jgi:uncharacterized phiE125 gp8 family phage protein
MRTRLVTASTDRAVTLAEAREYLRLPENYSEMGTLRRQRNAALQFCERNISGHRTFTRTTHDGYLAAFPGNDGRIELPLPPLYSSTGLSVTYYNTSNALTTLSSTVYDVLVPTEAPAYLQPKQDEAWPSARLRPDAVVVRFEAGFGAATAVPEVLKEAVLMKLEHLWDPARFPKPEAVDQTVRDMLSTYDYGAYA